MILLCCISVASSGQFKSASLAIDGLTCSMCSYSVERSIKKLKFVSTVSVDLNSNIAKVEFKPDSKTDIRNLIKSVRDAGFTVRQLTAQFNLSAPLKTDEPFFHFNNDMFIVLNPIKNEAVQGIIEVQFIEKSFSETALYKKYKAVIEKFSSDHFTNSSYYVVFI
jgi:copper chaperone CopZ